MIKKPILSTKIRNAIKKENPDTNLEFYLKNVIRNGIKYGSSGFIVNPETNTCVWLSTDNECCRQNIVYRFAKDTSDYHGGFNHWCNTVEELASDVTKMLAETNPNARR